MKKWSKRKLYYLKISATLYLLLFHLKLFRTRKLCFMVNDLEIHFFECFNNLGQRNDLNQSFRTQKYLKYFGLKCFHWIHLGCQICITIFTRVNTKRNASTTQVQSTLMGSGQRRKIRGLKLWVRFSATICAWKNHVISSALLD